jgi:RNA-directed DNA polymerase
MKMLQTKQKPFEIRFDRVVRAFKDVKANKGSYGVDEITLEAYEENLQGNLYKLWNRMSSGSYFPKPVKQVEIPKKGGGKRPLGIPAIEDRVAQAIVKRDLEIILEPVFHEDSYGYRHKKGVEDAVEKAKVRCWEYRWAVDLDIRSFFEDIPHDLLMKAVRKHTDCKWHLLYIERWLKAPVLQVDGTLKDKTKGTPQGSVVSPVLANLFLHYCMDEWMKRNVPECPFERYADDGLVHCMTENQAKKVKGKLEERFRQCGLTLHPEKTKVIDCRTLKGVGGKTHREFDFLGFTFRRRGARDKYGVTFTSFLPAISKKSAKSMREKVKEVKPLQVTDSILKDIAEELNPKIRGWIGSYGKFYPSELKRHLQYINKRLASWAKRKFKRFKGSQWNALKWLGRLAKEAPTLFEHWRYGVIPCV